MINSGIGNFFLWIERKSARKYYPICLTLFLIAISLFFAFPRYDLYPNTASNWDVALFKAKDLTNNLTFISPDSYLAKKVFRLAPELFIRFLHLNRPGILIFQAILGFFFILFSYKLAKRITNDVVSATLFAAGIVFLYCGRTCFTEVTYSWFDGWAYLFLLLAIYYRNFFAVFLFASLAAWTDERAFIALPIVILFHQVVTNKTNKFELKSFAIKPKQGNFAQKWKQESL